MSSRLSGYNSKVGAQVNQTVSLLLLLCFFFCKTLNVPLFFCTMLLCSSSAPNDGRRRSKATWNVHVRATWLGPRRDFAYYRGLAKPSRNKPPLTAADYYDVNSQHCRQKRGDDIWVDNGDGVFFNMRLLIAFETLAAAALSLSLPLLLLRPPHLPRICRDEWHNSRCSENRGECFHFATYTTNYPDNGPGEPGP